MVTQFGDRLGVPEAVGVSQCLLQGPGEALAQREEVQKLGATKYDDARLGQPYGWRMLF